MRQKPRINSCGAFLFSKAGTIFICLLWLHGNEIAMFLEIGNQFFVKLRLAQGFSIAENDEFHSGTGDGHVHATQVVEEADIAAFIVAHHADEDDIALLALETIYRVDGDLLSQWAKHLVVSHVFA